MRVLVALIPCLVFFLLTPMAVSGPDAASDYQTGLAWIRQGDWQKALEFWGAKYDSLPAHETDPRIGLAFIRLATEHEARDFYPQASKIYLKGFYDFDLAKHRNVVREEIWRLAPIMSAEQQQQQQQWLGWLDAENDTLLRAFKAFWVRNDPIPTTEINERLIEHWERVAYARKHFRNDSTTVYGTDDRGRILVKYGPPHTAHSGKLGVNQLEIMRWITTFSIRQEIQRYNTVPDYEIWVYTDLREDQASIFLFGKRRGYGNYGLLRGIEDFIPERAFDRTNLYDTLGIVPGFVLQIMFYRELIDVHEFFFKRYRTLESMWSNARAVGLLMPNYDTLRGLLRHYQSMDNLKQRFEYLPQDRTNVLEEMKAFTIISEQYRFLEDGTKPVLWVVGTAETPVDSEVATVTHFRTEKRSMFKKRFVLLDYAPTWDVARRLEDVPAIRANQTAVFKLEQTDSTHHRVLVVEEVALEDRKAQIRAEELADTSRVTGFGKTVFATRPPLSTDPTRLEVSDLILGQYAPVHVDTAALYTIPVQPITAPQVSEPLQVYFEMYRLALDSTQRATYTLEVGVYQIREGGSRVQPPAVAEKASFKADGANTSRRFELHTSGLNRGEYEIAVKVTDDISGRSKTRTARLTLLE